MAVDRWEVLDAFIKRELNEDAARLLAEPEPLGGGRYEWYAASDQGSDVLAALPQEEQRQLLALTEVKLNQLRDLARRARDDVRNAERRDLGDMLWAALAIPAERLEQSLFRVGGEPVLTNWGARLDRPDAASGPLIITLPPVPAPSRAYRFPWEIPLWGAFGAMMLLLFMELVDGCGIFNELGFGPDFCDAPVVNPDTALTALLKETSELQAQLNFLIKSSSQAPVCSGDAQPHIGSAAVRTVPPYEPPPEEVGSPSGDIQDAELHRNLNDSIRGAGGPVCPGIEVIAAWDEPADVDLRLYCLDEGVGGEVLPDQIVDAYNPESCSAVWDVGSAGTEAEKPFVERICILQTDSGEPKRFLATVYREDAQPGPVPVKIYARSGEILARTSVEAKPESETESGLPFATQ